MRLLKWLGVQLWKHPLVSGISVLAAAFTATSLAETALPGHAKAIEHVGGTVIGGGLLWLVILLLIIKAARRTFAKETSTAAVVVAVVGWIVYTVGFQVLAAILASSGNLAGTLSWLEDGITAGVGRFMIIAAVLFLQVGIGILLVIIPGEMHEYLPWDDATKLSRKLLPAWQAAAAAVMTWIDILLLHFAGGPLASTSLPVLMVAGFGVATLLLPLYHFIARSCWQYGAAGVFDPERWRDAFVNVRREVKAASIARALALPKEATYYPNPRAYSDPQDTRPMVGGAGRVRRPGGTPLTRLPRAGR